ncbi:hypothetical protein SAMN05421749_103250 [Acinetobacter marinus]|uniref:PsiF repeat-containing protein n=1 Tax=Acinetobacter marinus TaxID=281375 RepID=A0A1G6J846_9GAMM|nr:hypothetical protein [Acinetobacter marinus]SDC14096.1 hypothetical protein SAMN05421749_103250 [Acinetobacter marinus]
MKNMMLKTAGAFLVAALASQTYAADLSKSTNIRGDLEKNCQTSFTNAKVLSTSEASKFCKCTIDSQAKMTNADEWEIQSAINAKKDPRTVGVVKRTEQYMNTCAGADLIKKVQTAAQSAQAKKK